MIRLRLRFRRGYRTDAVELPFGDVLLGSGPKAHVVVDGAATEHAWLRPRRGRLLLAPANGTARRPVVDGARVDAPIVLGGRQTFNLSGTEVEAWLDEGPPSLSGTQLGNWRIGRELDSDGLARRTYEASSSAGTARVHQAGLGAPGQWWSAWMSMTEVFAREGEIVWIEAGPTRMTLEALLNAHALGAVRWPAEAGIVLITQFAEALCAYHDVLGVHGALRPELIVVDIRGRLSLRWPVPGDRAWSYQPEAVRLGAAPTFSTDMFGWWCVAQQILGHFPQMVAAKTRLPVPPSDRSELLAAAEGIRTWSDELGLDPTAVHVARGVGIATKTPPIARIGAPGGRDSREFRRHHR